MNLYCRLFKECAKDNLKFWECPPALFSLTGILNILSLLTSYFFTSKYASPDIMAGVALLISFVMIVLGYFISEAVRKINNAKRAAEEEKSKTEAIITNLTDGLIMLSPECKILFINPAACEILGINDSSSVLLKSIQEKSLLKKYPRLAYVFNWCPRPDVFGKNKVVVESISFGAPKKYFNVYTTRVTSKDGHLFLGYIKIFHDVTQEKELDKLKSEFIFLTSHQLRGPLSGMRWLLELILQEKIGRLNLEQKKYLNEILNSNEKMIKLIAELLDVARLEENKMELKLRKVNLKEVLDEVVKAAVPQALKKKINLNFLPTKNLFYAKIDIDKIKMVGQNLIENAIKYTNRGGRVKVTIEEVSAERLQKNFFLQTLSSHKALKFPAYILISVCDTGIGISEEDKKRIFAKFYRGKEAKKISTLGTGLGLYFSRQIVEKHQGFIWFKSQEGKGTCFYVALPKNLV